MEKFCSLCLEIFFLPSLPPLGAPDMHRFAGCLLTDSAVSPPSPQTAAWKLSKTANQVPQVPLCVPSQGHCPALPGVQGCQSWGFMYLMWFLHCFPWEGKHRSSSSRLALPGAPPPFKSTQLVFYPLRSLRTLSITEEPSLFLGLLLILPWPPPCFWGPSCDSVVLPPLHGLSSPSGFS